MAEEGSVYDLKGLEKQLHTLFDSFTCNDLKADSGPFCTDFCKLVEEYASHWQVPLSQLRILEIALCYFARASAVFTENCDHVHRTLSSLSLSIFELLLFFDQRDFDQDSLKQFTITFQECCSALIKHQNVHLLQVERLLSVGGPWASQTLQAILSESTLPQTKVEECISSEPPVFYELRVRYLLSCQRLPEALALAKCCAQHPTVGQHLFFLQLYLTGLHKTSQHERLYKELADFSGKEAVHIICGVESEEEDELLLGLSRAFLSQQLRKGDMHFLCDLVLIWSKLHSRLKTPKEALLKECQQLMLSATNVNSIFPFIKVITQELNEDGVQFCVELCANALQSCLPCDVVTKSLIYKTIAGLLPNDLEICRACALLVFFLERSVEAYKMVYILYMHPDQEYQIDSCPIRNNVRFETLQVLKKDMCFDPEFWNLVALRTNCLKLMNEKVLSSALEEIVEEKWIPSHCLKAANPSSSRSICRKETGLKKAKKPHKGDQQNHKDETVKASKRLKMVNPQINNHQPLKKKSNQVSRQWKKVPPEPLRHSSFWQLDRIHSNRSMECRENKRTTRLSDKIPHKRTIKKPKWLLEDSGTLEINAPLKARRQHQRFYYTTIVRRNGAVKNNTKDKVNSRVKLEDNEKKLQKELPLDSHSLTPAPQVILELSLPDNELMGTFADEPCKRHRGFPQKLFYKPTVKVPSVVTPEKPPHQKEVILKAQDTATFMQMLHCYTRRPKGKKIWTNVQGSASTKTRSSGQTSAAKEEQICDKPAVEMKVTISSQTDKMTTKVLRSSRQEIKEKVELTREMEKIQEAKVTQSDPVAKVLPEPTVEMKVPVTSRKHRHSPRLEKNPNAEHILKTVLKKVTTEEKKAEISDTTLPISSEGIELSEDPVVSGEELINGTPNQEGKSPSPEDENSKDSNYKTSVIDSIPEEKTTNVPAVMDSIDSLPDLESEIKTDATQNVDNQKDPPTDNSEPIEFNTEDDASQQTQPLPGCAPPAATSWEDDGFDETEPLPECEESKLEFCCVLCHREIKGSRVVVHAMFHYRKDECMFCGVTFKNDLKAMIHLSNHLEKLKKQQNDNKIQEKYRTKDKPKPPVKAKTISNEKRSPGRPKKSLSRLPESITESRKLRSSDKIRDEKPQGEQSNVKHLRSKSYVQKVNGHIGKRKNSDGIKERLITKTKLRQRISEKLNENIEVKPTTSSPAKKETEKPLVVMETEKTQQEITCKANSITDKTVTFEDKLCCPVDGCSWFSHKNRIAFLCHAMEEHKSDMRPLELSFRTANNMCSICKRVLYSFEHFLHHIERHRDVPRHPCLHKGCTARFNSIKEMRRHARKHSPLQAVCCLPGCPKLFICLWALILHEKDHYSKGAITVQKDNKQQSTQVMKQENHRPKDTATKKEERKKSAWLKRQTSLNNKKVVKASNDRNETKDLSVLKKNLSAQPAATRLLLKLRKKHVIKTNVAQQRTLKIVSSVGKPNYKSRHSLKKKGDKLNSKTQTRNVLPPRLTRTSSGKSVLPENPKQESNQEETSSSRKRHKEKMEKNLDKAKTRSKSDQKEMPNVKFSRKKLTPAETPNRERNQSAQKVEETAVVDSPVIEANANMEATDGIAPVIVSVSPSETSVEKEKATITEESPYHGEMLAEKVACQNKPSKPPTVESKTEVHNVEEGVTEVVGNSVVEENALVKDTVSPDANCETVKTHVDYEVEQVAAPVVENNAQVNPETSIIETTINNNGPVVSNTSDIENCEHVATSVMDCSELDKISEMDDMDSSIVPQSPPAIQTVDHKGEHVLTLETPAVEDFKMVAADFSPESLLSIWASAVMTEDQNIENVATLENSEDLENTKHHTYDSCPPAVTTKIQHHEYASDPEDISADEMSKMVMAEEPEANSNENAFESTRVVENTEAPIEKSADDNLKIQTVVSSATDRNGSIAITSNFETVDRKEPENLTVKENTDSTTNNTTALFSMSKHVDGASGKAGPEAGGENDKKLSVFKTLAKLKKFMEKRTLKRELNEPVENSSSKKSKSEMQNKDKAASVVTNSAIEEKKDTETATSTQDTNNTSAPGVISNVSDVNETSKDELSSETKLAIKRKTTRKREGSKSNMQGNVIKPNNVNKTSKDKSKMTAVGSENKLVKRKTHARKEHYKSNKSKDKVISKAEAGKKSREKCKEKRIIERKKKLSESKMGKSVSKDPNFEAATKNLLSSGSQVEITIGNIETAAPVVPSACSLEANEEPIACKENHQAMNVQETNEVQIEAEDNEESCLKYKQRVYDLVPEEEESPLVAFEKALTEYKKRPYMRLPATAYLEEKFTTMPKRRKDMSTYFGSSQKIQKVPQQIQRCANCFATFSTEEDLQQHLQHKCSNMFGFDSDEEGTS